MREIKFRAKSLVNFETHIEGIEIGDWVYGYYYFDRANLCGIIVTDFQEESGGVGSGIMQCRIKVDYKTLGQFIELQDKNDKEIYEGDIIQHVYYGLNMNSFPLGIVEYDVEWAGFGIRWGKNEGINLHIPWDSHIVIDNIYEKPELAVANEN